MFKGWWQPPDIGLRNGLRDLTRQAGEKKRNGDGGCRAFFVNTPMPCPLP